MKPLDLAAEIKPYQDKILKLEAENANLKEHAAGSGCAFYEVAEKRAEEIKSLALQLVAVREGLKWMVSEETDWEDGEVGVGHKFRAKANQLLSTPPLALVAQMEKKMEAAGKMAEALKIARSYIRADQMTKEDYATIENAKALWNTANEGGNR